ncbi:uncharacterized protein SEPMUDRAFT_149730 [Sphaerulina musiva SO2202]|uniref:Bet v1-like protein n=1 Tax=Sphaerulina musiva (strain SO2202) TaxID=692275 RepID=N1QHF3_SPHMS|nr:uncharacterized protein SEPMUDRAFT_149730 [Sphaerulina musiva SO2202]EMF11874.1 hypothetical protein SEPMUDRAFT_149730 [Sphaerulina musiva SO2202]
MAPGAAYTDHQFRSNAYTGPRATPTIPDGGKFSVYAEIAINTPPQYPYEALLDLHSWREWNTFNPDVLITKHPQAHRRNLRLEQGTFMTFTVQMNEQETLKSKQVCMHLDPLKHKHDGRPSHAAGGNVTRIRWVSDNANYLVPGFVIKDERVNEIEEKGDDACVYRTWITFSGFAAKNWKKKHEKDFQQKIVDFCEDMKRRCEAMHKENPNLEVEDGRERARKSMQLVRKSEDQLRALQGGKPQRMASARSNGTA